MVVVVIQMHIGGISSSRQSVQRYCTSQRYDFMILSFDFMDLRSKMEGKIQFSFLRLGRLFDSFLLECSWNILVCHPSLLFPPFGGGDKASVNEARREHITSREHIFEKFFSSHEPLFLIEKLFSIFF